jgi:hypothetical protein
LLSALIPSVPASHALPFKILLVRHAPWLPCPNRTSCDENKPLVLEQKLKVDNTLVLELQQHFSVLLHTSLQGVQSGARDDRDPEISRAAWQSKSKQKSYSEELLTSA